MQDGAGLTEMQRYIANVGITGSALRGLGAAGFVRAAQEFLAGVALASLTTIDPSQYPDWLESETEALMEAFPKKGLWGPARKSMNIFMVMTSLNRFMCTAYALDRLEDALEVPLDNRVARAVLAWAKRRGVSRGEIPRWKSIKALDQESSEKFQKLAAAMATERGIPRGRLDVALWPERGGKGD
jgi:hypothetical protein